VDLRWELHARMHGGEIWSVTAPDGSVLYAAKKFDSQRAGDTRPVLENTFTTVKAAAEWLRST